MKILKTLASASVIGWFPIFLWRDYTSDPRDFFAHLHALQQSFYGRHWEAILFGFGLFFSFAWLVRIEGERAVRDDPSILTRAWAENARREVRWQAKMARWNRYPKPFPWKRRRLIVPSAPQGRSPS
jgi:hypothetical protein